MIIDKLKSDINTHKLFAKGEKILVCVSGGPDSVFLLHCLRNLPERLKLKLYVAHVNHNLRGAESDAEELFVCNLSLSLGLPFFKCSVPTELIASKEKLTIEEAARNLRYNFFKNLCHIHKIKKIILAHTKDDQVETIIMRILRGTGIKGLGGMSFQSVQGAYRLIRPLLEIEKKDIVSFLKKNKIEYKIDSSNLKPNYFRNKVRLEIMPRLKELSPQIKENIFRIGIVSKQADDILQKKVSRVFSKIVTCRKNNIFSVNKQLFLKHPFVIRSEVIRRVIGNVKGDLNGIDFKHVRIVDDFITNAETLGKHLDLPKDIFIKKSRKVICFGEKNKDKDRSPKNISYLLDLGGWKKIPELNMSLHAEKVKGFCDVSNIKKCSPNVEYLDFDTIKFPLEVRLRKDGDMFHPLGGKGRKKLKKFFIDQKLDDEQKDDVGLVVSGGIIAWVIGMRLGDPFKITKKTRQVVRIQARFLKNK